MVAGKLGKFLYLTNVCRRRIELTHSGRLINMPKDVFVRPDKL
jgi:hypothetical protein